jgi:hypothetical protein
MVVIKLNVKKLKKLNLRVMNWFEDWEYPNDHIYHMERKRDIERSWQQWEEDEKKRTKTLPAIIKIKTVNHEDKRNTRTVRRTHQKRI